MAFDGREVKIDADGRVTFADPRLLQEIFSLLHRSGGFVVQVPDPLRIPPDMDVDDPLFTCPPVNRCPQPVNGYCGLQMRLAIDWGVYPPVSSPDSPDGPA